MLLTDKKQHTLRRTSAHIEAAADAKCSVHAWEFCQMDAESPSSQAREEELHQTGHCDVSRGKRGRDTLPAMGYREWANE
jgi:hypothetical protein